MKNTLFFACFLMVILSNVSAQTPQIPNRDFQLVNGIDCPYNPESTITWPKDWMIYQTQNGLWDGPIDSTRCISVSLEVESFWIRVKIALNQIDPNQPLFIRQSLTGEKGIPLRSDFVYKLRSSICLDNDILLTGDNCNATVCSGVLAVVEIPDESGTGVAQRVHTSNLTGPSFHQYAETCIVTEYFDKNILRELICKISFQGDITDEELVLQHIFLQESYVGVSPNACLMFRDKGTLSIPNDTRFVYGDEGIGALGLDKGGTIKIGQHSELFINNTTILVNYTKGPDQQVYLELNPGSRLTFGKQARLIRKGHVQTGQMRLNVYMKGGILDDSQLRPEDRALINRIYPEEHYTSSAFFQVKGNPVSDVMNLSIQAKENNASGQWIIRNLNGQTIRRGSFSTQKGPNTFEIRLEDLASGMYILEMVLGVDRGVQKFVRG